MCRWPIFTGLLALLVGLSVINCGTSAPARVFGRRLALAEWQRDARRADEPAGVTQWQPSTVDLGIRCGANQSPRSSVAHACRSRTTTTIQSRASRATNCFRLPKRSKHSSSGYSSRHRTRAWRFKLHRRSTWRPACCGIEGTLSATFRSPPGEAARPL